MAIRVLHWTIGILLVVGYLLALPESDRNQHPSFQPAYSPTHVAIGDQWQLRFASEARTALVHAASMVELPDGRIRAFWFAGSREGAADVNIHSAVFDPAVGDWSDEVPVVSREQVSRQWGRYVRKLGNAVPVIDADGRLRLFVVAVSFGGWAASRLVVLESHDSGSTWVFDEALTTSPFLNISTLVKAPPVRYADGSVGLPVYHEWIGKFGELLRLDENNHLIDKERIGHGRKAIQPLIMVSSPRRATAYLRNESDDHPGMLYRSDTSNGGADWTPLASAGVANPSAAVGGVALAPDHWLLVANCNGEERDDLCLQETLDSGETWATRFVFHDRHRWRAGDVDERLFMEMIDEELTATLGDEHTALLRQRVEHNKCQARGCEFQYDYPYVIQARNGDIHLLYTWNKSAIRHAWLPASDENGENG